MISKSRRASKEHDAAKRLRDLGYTSIPMRNKQPDVPWRGLVDVLPTDEQLREWFLPRDVGVGVVCGSLLAVRDYDAVGAYPTWKHAYGDVAACLATVRTGRQDGYHVWGRVHPDCIARIRASLGNSGDGAIAFDDGELRTGAAVVVVPPSPHASGGRYTWKVPLDANLPDVDPAEIGWLPANVTEPTEANRATRSQSMPCCGSVGTSEQGAIEAAITATQPTKPGQRNNQLFRLARKLKAIDGLGNAKPKDLRPIVVEWHRRAQSNIKTRELVETLADFNRAWKRAQFAEGESAVTVCLERAIELPLPTCAEVYDSQKFRVLVALCKQLQLASGGSPFYLSARTAAQLLGVTPMTISRWLGLLVDEEIIELVSRGSHGTWKASRYRYLGD